MQKYLITVLLLFCAVYADANPPGLRVRPHEGYEVKDGKIYFRRGQAGIMVELATPELIEKYYKDRGASIGNPFSNLDETMQNPVFLLVTLFNRTNGNLTFTPRYVLAKIKTEAYFPLDYLTMMEVLEGQESTTKKILEKSIYHSPELLSPGDVVTKFLIFPILPKKFQDMRLSFDYLYFENHEIKSDFFFTTKLND